jgi:hypothetical protein
MSPDESMKFAYKTMYNIDPNECERIIGNLQKKLINLGTKKQTLVDFVNQHTRIVAIDNVSTKEANLKAMENLPENIRDRYKTFYLEMIRNWGVIEYESNNVGVIDRTLVYNGFPNYVDSNEFARDPNGVIDRFFQIPSIRTEEKFFAAPKIYTAGRLALHRNFLKEHPIEDKPKTVWEKIGGIWRKK